MLNNMRVATRLAILAGTLIAFMLIIGVMGISGMRDANLGMRTVYNDRVVPMQQLKDVIDDYALILVDTPQKSTKNIISLQEAQRISAEVAPQATQLWKDYLATELVDEEVALIKEATPLLKKADEQLANLQTWYINKDTASINNFAQTGIYPIFDPLNDVFTRLCKVQTKVAKQEYELSSQRFEKTRTMNISMILLSLVVATIIGFLITRSLLMQLGGEPNYTAQIIAQVANGDLAARAQLSTKDQGSILFAINQMIFKLSSIITEVRSSADSLSAASEEVSATAQSLSQSATEQAASVEETSASMEEISASINQNNDNAKVTDSMATKSAKEASQSGEAVNNTVAAMQKIAERISVIDDIAYQTNLLALNAAIEAGRAGEHGRGFAVVASEVRKLAGRSQTAAKEIGELANSSVKQAVDAGNLLNAMVPSIRKTADLVQEISAASNEQSMGANQITIAISQISIVTQQNSTAAEELYSTAEELSHQAAQLQEMMEFFKLGQRR
jgi:methyl-accepting chemotaxis protein